MDLIEQRVRIIEAMNIQILLLQKAADDTAIAIVEDHVASLKKELEEYENGTKS